MKKSKESNLKNKKGISLIVLVITIIVIIILAAAVILTLTGNNPIENAKQAAYVNDLSTFQDELDMYKAKEYAKNLGDFDPSTLNANSENTALLFTYIPSLEGKTKYIAEFSVTGGQLIYTGEPTSVHKTWAAIANIADGTAPVVPEEPVVEGANAPVLATGMTAIKWNTTTNSWDDVSNPSTDTSWYSYTETDKKWANAKTLDGSMWVWIPRYEYKIANTHNSTAQTIDVNFINGTGNGIGGDYTTTYGLHPAFTFGTDQLTGIWVAKFEASGTTSAVDIKPGVASLRSITIDAMFTASRNMETNSRYGWGTTGTGIDTHLMKNVEWGAAAYLSSSAYGKTGEITINDNTSYLTGGGTTNAYTTNLVQSTTGNVYGIYDMSGGAWEYTAAYLNNGDSSLNSKGLSLVSSNNKYKDIYTITTDNYSNNYDNSASKKGEAIYETSSQSEGTFSWYSDTSYMPRLNYPFFTRGSSWVASSGIGIFAFSYEAGSGLPYAGFRTVLVVNNTL